MSEKKGSDLKKVEWLGGMWGSLFAFFFNIVFVYVILSTIFVVVTVWEDSAKAMALQRNVVYTVTRWMDGMNGRMNGWMDVTKNTDAHKARGAGAGAGRSSDHCLFFLRCRCLLLVFLSFCPVVLEKRRGCSENPRRHEDSPVLFCHFFSLLNFLLKNPPPFLHHVLCEATSKLLVRHKVLFFVRL